MHHKSVNQLEGSRNIKKHDKTLSFRSFSIAPLQCYMFAKDVAHMDLYEIISYNFKNECHDCPILQY